MLFDSYQPYLKSRTITVFYIIRKKYEKKPQLNFVKKFFYIACFN